MRAASLTRPTPYERSVEQAEARAPLGAGMAFLWIAFLVNAAWFSAFAVSTGGGILRAIANPTPMPPGYTPPADGAGVQLILIEVVGVMLLGVALAYAAYRYYTRDRRLDPLTEAATKDIYDNAARAREDD